MGMGTSHITSGLTGDTHMSVSHLDHSTISLVSLMLSSNILASGLAVPGATVVALGHQAVLGGLAIL